MTTVAEFPKTAVRLPNLGKLWRKSRVKLRPQEVPTRRMTADEIPTRRMQANEIPTRRMQANEIPTRRMQANEIPTRRMQANEIPTRRMQANEIPTRRMQANEIPTRRMQANEIPTRRMTADEVPTSRMRHVPTVDPTTRIMRQSAGDPTTRIMRRPEGTADLDMFRPSVEELDQILRDIPRGMQRKMGSAKVAIRLPGIASKLPSLKLPGVRSALSGAMPKLRDAVGDLSGSKLRSRGKALIQRPGARRLATSVGAKALRAGNLRGAGSAAAGGAAGIGGLAMAGGGESAADAEAAQTAEAVQSRLDQRMSSPLGGLLDDVISPETEDMAAAREAKRGELGDNISLMQRWQLMDPSMRTLLVSLLFGGGLGAVGAMTR